MKPFAQHVWASALGFLIAGIALSIISVFLTVSLVSGLGAKETVQVEAGTILKINLEGELLEYASDPFASLSFSMGDEDDMAQASVTLDAILTAIAKAKDDANISGIYLQCGALSAAPASLSEIRHALEDFKASGKFVYGYADQAMTQGVYYVASVADSLILNPQGILELSGMASTVLYYKEIFDKVGVKPEIFKVGTFKSAVEPYTEKEMSAANREQITSYLNGIWNNILTKIAASRNIEKEQLNALVDECIMFRKASFALDNRLIDALYYESEVKDLLAKKTFCSVKNLKLMDVNEYNDAPSEATKEFRSDKVAIIYAAGQIYSSLASNSFSQGEQITHKSMIKEIERVQNDDHIKAVVFRVNSPGGDAFASDQICHAIDNLAKVKPVVVSMGDYAASGGYYISSHATKIMASPTTLTGSIGIFGTFFTAEEIAKKVGLHYSTVKTNEYADFGTLVRSMKPGEKALLQSYIENGYDNFVHVCATGRNMEDDAIRKIAEGRVWTGEQGLEIGLVDTLGYLNDAVAMAAQLAGVEEYRIVKYPEEKDLATILMESFSGSVKAWTKQHKFGLDKAHLMELEWFENHSGIKAMAPYTIEMN